MKKPSFLKHPLVKENNQYLWYFLAFVIVSDLLVVFIRYSEGLPLAMNFNNVLISISMVTIPMITVNTIYFFKKWFLKRCSSNTQIMLLKISGLLIGVTLGTLLFELIYGHYGFEDDDYIVLGSLEFSASTTEFITNITYALFIGVPVFLRQQTKAKAEKEIKLKGIELEKAKRLQTQSQLQALQARVNPHFLYNALNSIASLIHVNPNQAEEMVLSLSELFRYTLNKKEGELATIQQEITMIKTYMAIELARFQGRLAFTVDVQEGLKQTLIPRFLLQPLVENAIKHGTSKIKNGSIAVKIWKEKNELKIKIADNGPNFNDSVESFTTGYGLKSVTDQLSLIYNENHSFKMLNKPEKHVLITILNPTTE